MTLPNFLGIGAERSATSWIYENIRQHPDVFVSSVKELHFFSWEYSKGLDWYSQWFSEASGFQAIGEISPEYIYHSESAQRIFQNLPDVRLILSLRNPVDRAYSQYGWRVRRNMESRTFDKAIQDEPDYYLEKGNYYPQLQSYLDLFRRDQILILLYENLQHDPVLFFKQILHFLEVNDNFVPDQVSLRRNIGITTQSSRESRLVLSAAKWIFRHRKLRKLSEPWRSNGIVKTYLEKRVLKNKNMDPSLRATLLTRFRESNEQLSELLGVDLLEFWQ